MAHVFISYVRDDREMVDRLARELQLVGIDVWLDRERLQPGQRWRDAIRTAIRSGACFLACFSPAYERRHRTYMNEELAIAVEELRLRPTSRTWFIPILLAPTTIPERQIGASESLRDLQWADVYTNWEAGIATIIQAVIASGVIPADAPTVPEIALARAIIKQNQLLLAESQARFEAERNRLRQQLQDLIAERRRTADKASESLLDESSIAVSISPEGLPELRIDLPALFRYIKRVFRRSTAG